MLRTAAVLADAQAAHSCAADSLAQFLGVQAAKEAAYAQLLERVATQLPPGVLLIVLGELPGIEVACLACVHTAFRDIWWRLRQERNCWHYSPPEGLSEEH